MNRVVYEETQRFAGWVYAMVLFLLVGVVVAVWARIAKPPSEDSDTIPGAILLILAVLLLLICNLFVLRVKIREQDIYVSLGVLFPMLWRRLGYDRIHDQRVITYRPLRDAGGWGVRLGLFEGKPTSFFNARGNRGVLLITDHRPFIIGSQNPEPLADAIAHAREQHRIVHG